MKYFPLIWAGLWRKWARTLFTMLSIVVAFLLFGLIQGINQGLNTVTSRLDVDRLYISAKSGMTDGLPIAYLERIKAVPGVRVVSHWTFFGGYYQNARNSLPAFATNAEGLFDIYKNQMKIKPEYVEAMKRTRTGVVVADSLVKQYGWKVGQRIPVGTSIWTNKNGSNTWYFDIVGTFDASGSGGLPTFYLNYDYFKEAAAFGGGPIHYYLVGITDPHKATQIASAIDKVFENSEVETRTQTESELAQQQLKQIGDINFIANAIVGAVLFTLLFLTGNTMMQSVRERTSELAVLKTLGFSDAKVVTLVLIESLLLCLAAAFMGLGLASLIFPAFRAIFGDFAMPGMVVAMGAGMAVALALLSGFPPAWRAGRLKIVDALAGR